MEGGNLLLETRFTLLRIFDDFLEHGRRLYNSDGFRTIVYTNHPTLWRSDLGGVFIRQNVTVPKTDLKSVRETAKYYADVFTKLAYPDLHLDVVGTPPSTNPQQKVHIHVILSTRPIDRTEYRADYQQARNCFHEREGRKVETSFIYLH